MATITLRHKHVQHDQRKLDRARRVLGARTETETLDRALALVVTEADIDRALPSATVWEDAGHVLRALQELRGYRVAGSRSLVNDVLIALSARAIGATVVTSNARDFAAIREIRPFELTAVAATAAPPP